MERLPGGLDSVSTRTSERNGWTTGSLVDAGHCPASAATSDHLLARRLPTLRCCPINDRGCAHGCVPSPRSRRVVPFPAQSAGDYHGPTIRRHSTPGASDSRTARTWHVARRRRRVGDHPPSPRRETGTPCTVEETRAGTRARAQQAGSREGQPRPDIVQWVQRPSPRAPRNVAIRREDGTVVIRPF